MAVVRHIQVAAEDLQKVVLVDAGHCQVKRPAVADLAIEGSLEPDRGIDRSWSHFPFFSFVSSTSRSCCDIRIVPGSHEQEHITTISGRGQSLTFERPMDEIMKHAVVTQEALSFERQESSEQV
jgi:hypothetical protein